MRRSTKVFGFVFSLFALLIAFQNCGRIQKSTDTALDDRVTKIETPSLDDSDDKTVLSDIQSYLLFNIQAAATDAGKDLINQIEVCRKFLGDEKRSCTWDVVQKYYALLKDSGWFVTEEKAGCIIAVSDDRASLGTELTFSATCHALSSESPLPHAIHLDECINDKAFATLKRARFFQHARSTVSYKLAGAKKVELFIKQESDRPFVDACEKEHAVSSVNLALSVLVQN